MGNEWSSTSRSIRNERCEIFRKSAKLPEIAAFCNLRFIMKWKCLSFRAATPVLVQKYVWMKIIAAAWHLRERPKKRWIGELRLTSSARNRVNENSTDNSDQNWLFDRQNHSTKYLRSLWPKKVLGMIQRSDPKITNNPKHVMANSKDTFKLIQQ